MLSLSPDGSGARTKVLRAASLLLLSASMALPALAQTAPVPPPFNANASTGYWPLDLVINALGGVNLDNQVSRNSSSLQGLFTSPVSQLFATVSQQVGGAYNESSAYLGYDPVQILKTGVSIDQVKQAGMVVPDDVFTAVGEDIRSRFGTYVARARVAPALMRDAQRRAESAALYSDTTDANGVVQPGFLTKNGANMRDQLVLSINQSEQNLNDQVDSFQQTSLQSAGTNYGDALTSYTSAGENYNTVAENYLTARSFYDDIVTQTSDDQAEVDSFATAAGSQPSTQLVLKQMASEFQAMSRLTAHVAASDAQARSKEMDALDRQMQAEGQQMVGREQEMTARQNEVAAAQVEAAVAVYSAKNLAELLKGQTAEIEEQKLNRLAMNRVGAAVDERAKLETFSDSYITQGALDNVDLLSQSMSNLNFEASP